MIKFFLNKIVTRTRVGFFAALFLLFISYILTFISTKKVDTQDFWMNHNNEVIHNLDNIISFTTKGESAFRGYLITDDKNFLEVYEQSIKNTDSTFNKVRILTINSDFQQRNLDTLHILIAQKFLWIGNLISTYSLTHKTSSSFLEGKKGTITETRDVEAQVLKMKQEENNLWNERSQKVSEYSNLIQVLNIISIVIAVLLTFYSLIVYNKENKARRIASRKAEEYKDQLQGRVKQLADLNRELIELRSLEKYVVTGRIARVIAHEVRNPLTNINLAAEQLRSEVVNDGNTEMLFSMIDRNSERINQLVSDLLNTTRVAELSFSESSINDILDASLNLALDRIELNQIEVIKEYDKEICPISVDVEKIKIAFLNIIVNAIEAMDEKGILRITTTKKNNSCIVKISDNGKGMVKADVDRLFEPYFTTKQKGNGLGLANSQNIILGHEGSISAESEPGTGTTFTITFRIT